MNIYVEEIGGWQAVRLTPWIPSSPTIAMVVLVWYHTAIVVGRLSLSSKIYNTYPCLTFSTVSFRGTASKKAQIKATCAPLKIHEAANTRRWTAQFCISSK